MFGTHTTLGFCIALLLSATTIRAGDRRLVILQSSDIHGRIEGANGAGWLRLSAAVKAERKAAGKACLWVDCGDTIQGTLSATLSKGEDSIAALKTLGVDVWVPGNHELDFGADRLQRIIDAKPFPILNGNLILGKKPVRAYRLVAVNGIRVAIIGMNSSRLPFWFVGRNYKGLKIIPTIERLEHILPDVMKKKPHLVILAIHDGLSASGRGRSIVTEVARRFPQIRLIMGGHTHREVPGKRLWGAHFVQPGCHGRHLAKVEIDFDQTMAVAEIRSKLIDVTTYDPDPEMKRVLAPYRKRERDFGRRVATKSSKPITADGAVGVDNHFSEVLCRAIKRASRAQVVLHGTHNEFGLKGPTITNRTLFYAIPYENQVFIVSMTKPELKEVLAEQLTVMQRGGMQGPHGVHVWLGSDNKIQRIKLKTERETIDVAVNGYCAAGAGGRMPKLRAIVSRKQCRELKKNTRELLFDYLKSDDAWGAPPTRWLHFPKKTTGKRQND